MIHRKLRWTIVSAALAAGLLVSGRVGGPAQAAPDDKEPARVFVGYLFAQPRNINFRMYTHLCHAFLVADGEGRVEKRGSVPSRELTGEATEPGSRCSSRWAAGDGTSSSPRSSPARPRPTARNSVVGIIDQFDYDGIDLDWEYPDTKEEVVGFERLTRRFRKALDDLGAEEGGRPTHGDGGLFQIPARAEEMARQGVPARDHGLDQRDDLRLYRRLDEFRRPSSRRCSPRRSSPATRVRPRRP